MSAKPKCCECGLKRHGVPAVRHVDGTIDYVCKSCWFRLDYHTYITGE